MRDLGDAAVALTAELVAVDSVNPGLVPEEMVRVVSGRSASGWG